MKHWESVKAGGVSTILVAFISIAAKQELKFAEFMGLFLLFYLFYKSKNDTK